MLLLQLLISGVGKPDLFKGARLSRRAHNPQSGYCALKYRPAVSSNQPPAIFCNPWRVFQ